MTTAQRPALPQVRPGRDGAAAGAAALSTSLRLVLGTLLGTAAVIHLALAPTHFRETAVFGAFFAVAGAVQLALAVRLLGRRDASWRLLALLRVTSLVLLGTYIATRLVTPPLAPDAEAEPVDVLGVLAAGVELASVVVVLALPARAGRTSTAVTALWAAAVACVYTLFFAVASGAVVYNAAGWPADIVVPSVFLRDAEQLSLLTPRVNIVPSEHLAVSAPLLTLLMLSVTAVLLGLNTALARAVAERLRSGRRPGLAAVPAFVAAPVCCGAPLLAFLGTGAVALLALYTPVLLAAVALVLAMHGSTMLRALRITNDTTA